MLKEIDAALAVLDDDKYEPLRILQEDLHYFIIKGCLPISRAIANIFRERIEEYNEPQRFYDLTRRVESLVAKLQSADNEASEAFVALRREIPDDYKLAEVDKSAIGEITSFMRQLAGQLKHDSTLKLPSTFGSDDKDAIYQAINLYSALHNFIFSRERILERNRSLVRSGWFSMRYLVSFGQPSAYYSKRLTAKRLEISKLLLLYTQEMLEKFYNDPLNFTITLTHFILDAKEKNESINSLASKQEGNGELDRILHKYVDSFTGILKLMLRKTSDRRSVVTTLLEHFDRQEDLTALMITNAIAGERASAQYSEAELSFASTGPG